MNTFGTLYRTCVFGSSHGPVVGAVVEGCPVGHEISVKAIQIEMDRRAPGKSPVETPRFERDEVEILSGLLNGRATDSPIAGIIHNRNKDSSAYDSFKRVPMPGHADYTATVKYGGAHDHRGGGQFSGRMTAGLVFSGAVARQVLEKRGIRLLAETVQIGSVRSEERTPFSAAEKLVRSNPVGCADRKVAERMKEEIVRAHEEKDSVGGIVRCSAVGMPVGVGEPFFGSVEGVMSAMMFSIPGVKGVEFGAGFGAASMWGSECNDPFVIKNKKIATKTNNAGGVLGGLTTGMNVEFQVAFKPTSSIAAKQMSVDIEKRKPVELVVEGRHDPCIVPRAVPVVENAAAAVLLDLMMQGGFL